MKKILCYILIICSIISIPVYAADIYETQVIPGITKKVITSYTSAGRQEANILEIDLGNPRLKVKLLTSHDGISRLSNVKNMASADERVVAAINGDFFAWHYQDKSRGSAVGLNVSEGELLTSAPAEEELASMVFTESGAVLSQYFNPAMTITDSKGNTEKISVLNKYSSLAELAMYNSHWGKTFYCNGGSEQIAVIKNDIVTEIICEAGEILIPDDGYLIAGLSDFTTFISNISPGDKITTDISFTPYFGDIETAIGGGTVLVKNGEKAPITHMRYGRDFRSALGVSRDNKTLYFITVDKSGGSVGMTLDELSSLMLSLNIFDGINLDGGGSTQLVARSSGDDAIRLVNSPENGYLRPVANALSITLSGGERGVMEGITIKTNADTVNIGSQVTASFIPYDQLYYPLEIDENAKVSYRFSGVQGSQSENSFIPTLPGTLEIQVSYKGFTAHKKIEVKDPDVYMDCDSTIYIANPGQPLPVTINAITLGKKQRTVPLDDVQVIVPENILEYKNGIITAKNPGFGEIKFVCGDFSFGAYVSVGGVLPGDGFAPEKSHYEGFEKATASALSYPAGTISEYEISDEKSTEGMFSGKLTFDFDNELTALQSSYVVFENPIAFSSKSPTLSVDVYSKGINDISLKAMITDSFGQVHRVNIGNLSEKGWTTHKIALPDSIPLPARLSRLYVVEENAGSKKRGSIYFDNLVLTENDMGDYSADILKVDNIENPQIIITGGVAKTDTLLGEIASQKIKSKLLSAPLGYSFENPQISPFDTAEYDNLTLISYKGISHLESSLYDSKKTVVIAASSLSEKDRQEIVLIQEKHPEKTFFVISKGAKVNVRNISNIRFITLPTLTPSILTNQKSYAQLTIGSSGGRPIYSISFIPLWN